MKNAGLDGVELCESEVCLIEPAESLCAFRGRRIERLAEERDYDEVACLLILGSLPEGGELEAFRRQVQRGRRVGADCILALTRAGWPAGAHPMDVLRSAVSLATVVAPAFADLPGREQAASLLGLVGEAGARICRAASGRGAAGAGLAGGDSLPAWFLSTAVDRTPSAADTAALNQVAILHAEHELNASTFTARVVASTLSDLTSAVVAAIGALKGPLHGGANEAALRSLEQIGSAENVEAWADERLQRKERVMGFGHRVYKRDPREDILRRLARERTAVVGRPGLYETAARLEAYLGEKKGLHANPDLYSGMIYEAIGLPGACATVVFAAARTSGWCAHSLEQLEHNRLIRPRARYVGPPAEREAGAG